MFDLSRKKSKPGTFYAVAFCINVIAFVMMCAGAFTPHWSQVTENDGTNDVTYDRGLVVSCDGPGSSGCVANANFGSRSGEMLAAFVMCILAIILAFLALQLFVVGQCVRSCREQNLGIPLTTLEFCIAVLLIATLAFFEVALTKETTSGASHRKDTFGFSRGLLIGAVILYFSSAFFSLGEYFKRQKPDRGDDNRNGVFQLRTSQHHNAKRVSHSDSHPDTYFRTRGTYHSSDRGGRQQQPQIASVGGIDLWR